MATITLTADTNYSALTVANDDTIDCAGFILTLDVAPTETGIQVTSPATNGRVVFSDSWNLSTWDFFAGATGTDGMITTLPSGATIKSMTGGTASGARGVVTNNGTIISVTGGSAASAVGVLTNNGTVTTSTGGSGATCHGVNTNSVSGIVTTANGGTNNNNGVSANNGTVTTANASAAAHGVSTSTLWVGTANGGTVSGFHGVLNNNHDVEVANGGSAAGSHGINTSNGSVLQANGGTIANAFGVHICNGHCFRMQDNAGRAVRYWQQGRVFIEGPFTNGIVDSRIKTIYSLGTLSASATIAGDATLITMSEGSGGRPASPFTQQVIG